MRKQFALGLVGMAMVLSMSACASGTPGEVDGTVSDEDSLTEFVYQYQGHDLHCVGRNVGLRSGLLSCDFVRYHAENG